MLKVKFIFIFIYLIFCSYQTVAQTRHINGFFPVNNYTNDDFHSPVQIWSGVQTDLGVYLFGNDLKIMRFNGEEWGFIEKNPEDTIYTSKQISEKKVYALFRSRDSVIYCSRYHSLGIIHYNKKGDHVYTPFYYDENYVDGWSISEAPDGKILFISSSKIISYDPDSRKISSVPLPKKISLGFIQNGITIRKGVLLSVSHVDNDSLLNIFGPGALYFLDYSTLSVRELNQSEKITYFGFRSSFNQSGNDYLVDYYGKVYRFKPNTNSLSYAFDLESPNEEPLRVNYLIKQDGLLWVATENHGVAIYQPDGKLIRLFGELEGLQDLNVFSLFFDKDKNLWLNLDNGISCVEFSAPTALWSRINNLEGAVEAIEYSDDRFLISSRSGVFRSVIRTNRIMFENTDVIKESTYDIKLFNTDFGNKVLIVGYSGVYEIQDFSKTAAVIKKDVYGWELYQSPFNKNHIFLGGEGFLGRFKLDQNGWEYEEIARFEGDIISFESMDDLVYFGVRGVGVYSIDDQNIIMKLPLAKKLDVDKSHFFFSRFNNQLFVGYSKGLLKIQNDSVVRASSKNLTFENRELNVHRLYRHPEKKELWAVIFDETNKSKTKIGYFKSDNSGNLYWTSVNSKNLENGVIYDIQYLNGLLYFGSTKGLISFDKDKLNNIQKEWEVYINGITVAGEKVLGIPEYSPELAPIEYGKPIRFDLRNASYFNGGKVLYRSRLIGLNDQWSDYENTNFKVFDQLPYGDYVFEIQGKNYYDVKSKIYRYAFTVLPPWYLTWWAYTLYIILFIMIIFIAIRISIYRVREQNKLLEETVKERTKEIAEKNHVLEKQKNEIVQINEDLLDSIKYAKRIQNTILPSPEILSTYFSDFFVFYLPKDIVSGDFYWARRFNNKIIWSAVDCTGHGVPGAFVSIVGNNALVRSTNEFRLSKPSEILNKLRELVIEAFKAQGTNDVKDGMDLALVSLDSETLELDYAGANNPLLVIRNKSIIEIKADKQPVGDFEIIEPFTNHTIQLEKGDAVYLFTDGFIDQFGGPKGKKFKSHAFKNLLVEISDLPMKEQKEIIINTFKEWKGDLDQIDDICIFGVRV
ncbi:MAG: SpoIIE family protein phosphatase [Brumimicrobium sp.]|nr:SpoIIE family protein phosphatase [Brumimicrobium sp.]